MDCPNINPSMCGKTRLHFAECDGKIKILPYIDGENAVHLPDVECEKKKRIVVYDSGVMIFNELPEDQEQNAQLYGNVVASWEAYDPIANPYIPLISYGYDYGDNTETIEMIMDIPWLDWTDTYAPVMVNEILFGEPIAPANMDAWFAYMSNLYSIDTTNLSLVNLESAEALFYNCTGLNVFSDSIFNDTPTNLQNTWHMFDGCTALTRVRMCQFDFSHITHCAYMFKNCRDLGTININGDFPQTANGTGMFYNCLSIVGAHGTTYDPNEIGITMAVQDTAEQQGYLSSCVY